MATARPTRRKRSAPSTRSTNTQLADSLREIGERTEDLLEAVGALQADHQVQTERLWTAMASITGLNELPLGVAQVVELLGPLRALTPPSTALPLEPGVAKALAAIRQALGPGLQSDTNFSSVPTDWGNPVGFIGEARAAREYPLTTETIEELQELIS